MGQRGIETKSIMSSQVINVGSTSYTSAVNSLNLVGAYAALAVTYSATGSLLIKQQASLDGINFYDPASATLTTAGVIYQQLFADLATMKYIQFTPVIAPWIRFSVNVVAAAATQTIAVSYVSQGERA